MQAFPCSSMLAILCNCTPLQACLLCFCVASPLCTYIPCVLYLYLCASGCSLLHPFLNVPVLLPSCTCKAHTLECCGAFYYCTSSESFATCLFYVHISLVFFCCHPLLPISPVHFAPLVVLFLLLLLSFISWLLVYYLSVFVPSTVVMSTSPHVFESIVTVLPGTF